MIFSLPDPLAVFSVFLYNLTALTKFFLKFSYLGFWDIILSWLSSSILILLSFLLESHLRLLLIPFPCTLCWFFQRFYFLDPLLIPYILPNKVHPRLDFQLPSIWWGLPNISLFHTSLLSFKTIYRGAIFAKKYIHILR